MAMVQPSGWIVKVYQQLQETECLVLDSPFFFLDKWKSLYLSFHKHCPYNWRARFKFKLIRLFCFPKLHDNGPVGKLSHGSLFAVMGTNLIRNRAGLVMSPTSHTDTHSDPRRPEVPFVHAASSVFSQHSYICVLELGVIISAQAKLAEGWKTSCLVSVVSQ